VSEAVSTGLEPGLVIGSRYRVEERLVDGDPIGYLATDTERQLPVVVLDISAEYAKLLVKAKALGHTHLGNVLDVAQIDGKNLAICERLPGERLDQRLAEIGHKPPVDAVRSALRVADALSSLHEVGGAHGLVHPVNVVLSPDGRDGPVLVFAPLPPGDAAFRQPEWESGDLPSEPDDSWGAAALLHMMLLGKPPTRLGYESESGLADAGVQDPVLRAALYHALARDLGVRGHDLRPLKRELARWFVEHAGEEPIPSGGRHSTHPPPLPPSLRPDQLPRFSAAPRASVPAPPAAKKPSKLLMLASFGATIGLLGGWAFSHLRSRTNVKVVEVQKPQAEAASKKAIDLSDVPVNGQSQSESTDKVGSCVSGYLPKGTFDKAPDMSWVCDESDPRTGAEKLRVAVVNGGKGNLSEAMKIFARMGWYDMAAFAVVRTGCCENAKPLSLPAPGTACTPLADSLRDIGSAVVAARPYDEPMKAYTAAIHCELNAGHGAALRHTSRPTGGEDSAFGELVHAVQQ
jgi:hypothetical protein